MIDYVCDCCGHTTQLEDAGEVLGFICGECHWEWDSVPDSEYGPNQYTLAEARENYRKHGRCEPNCHGTWD